MKIKYLIAVSLLLFILVGCSSPPEPIVGAALLNEQFDDPKAWEVYNDDTSDLQTADGAYRITTGDQGYIWGLNEQSHQDVVIDVDTSQLSAFEDNAYGVMCRADTSNNGDGYYFLISGDGMVSIRKGEGDDVSPLVDWESDSSVNEGASSNSLRAVCIGDYLALYVNGEFATSANDATYTSGYAGFAAAAADGGDIAVTFDNLIISEASLPAE
jgi:hypothetical protein